MKRPNSKKRSVNRIRKVLLYIILATIPFYCLGFISLRLLTNRRISGTATSTTTPTITSTITATEEIPSTQTRTDEPTATQTRTRTPTISPEPSETRAPTNTDIPPTEPPTDTPVPPTELPSDTPIPEETQPATPDPALTPE